MIGASLEVYETAVPMMLWLGGLKLTVQCNWWPLLQTSRVMLGCIIERGRGNMASTEQGQGGKAPDRETPKVIDKSEGGGFCIL